MKRLGIAALALGGLVAVSFALALLLIDGETVRDAIGASLEQTLGESVELGAVDLSVFPLPAARIRDARIGDPAAPRLAAKEVRVGVSLASLLAGQVVLRSLELESPRLRLPAPGETPSAPPPPTSSWNAARAAEVRLAITRLVVHDGTLELGPHRLEQVEVSGDLGATLGASLDFSAQIPELGRIEAGVLEIANLSAGLEGWTWTATAQLAELDLTRLRERLDFRGLWGKAAGKLSAAGTGSHPESATLELESKDLDIRSALLRLWGPTQLTAKYPSGKLELDLTQAQVAAAQLLEKPSGVPLRISAREVAIDPVLRVGELRIESDAVSGSGKLELAAGSPSLDLSTGSLDLAALAASWTGPSWLPRAGRVDIERLRLAGEPLALRAAASLSAVRVELPSGLPVLISGPVFSNGTTLGADALNVEIAGEMVSTSLRYDWLSKQIQLGLVTEGLRVGPVLEALAKFKEASGRLYARVELAGPLDPYALRGQGEFDLVDGGWRRFSLASALIREPPPDFQPSTDPIEHLRGRFEVDEDEVHVTDVVIDQTYAQARLSATIYLRDLTLDGAGEVEIYSPDLAEPIVLPILKVGGQLNQPNMTFANNDENEEVRKAEAGMIEAFRKAEREMREKERAKRKQTQPSGG